LRHDKILQAAFRFYTALFLIDLWGKKEQVRNIPNGALCTEIGTGRRIVIGAGN